MNKLIDFKGQVNLSRAILCFEVRELYSLCAHIYIFCIVVFFIFIEYE